MASKRLKCLSCSNWLLPWGKTKTGKKRYYCSVCKTTRLFRRRSNKQPQLFKLFRQYVLWGDTYEKLSALYGYSIRYLNQRFNQFLKYEPPKLPPLKQTQAAAYLLIDGLWFGRWFVLMVYRQSKNLTILHIGVAGKEVSSRIIKDLKNIRKNYRFAGIVSDGGTGIRRAVFHVFGNIPHQICLAHTHRQAVNALGRYPKDERVKKLKRLADHLWLIESKEALRWWSDQLQDWVQQNRDFLREYHRDEQNHWWFIHKGVRKAVRVLVSTPDFCFVFLSHHLMPKTTNELEAQFGHLGKRWLIHRGLKKERWVNFMKWFVYFYNQEKLSLSK